jgi:hypothetical protein
MLAGALAAMLLVVGQAGADRGKSRGQNPQGSQSTTQQTTQQQPTQQAPTTTVAPASVGRSASVEGVVQAVFASTVLVKQLDGSAVVVPVDRRTQVLVNGRQAQWSAVKPGFVLIGSWQPGRPAALLRFLRPS